MNVKRILSAILCAVMLFSLCACSDPETSSNNTDKATDSDSDAVSSEKTEPLTSADVLAQEERLVGLCDQINSRIIVCDLAVEDWTDNNAVVWEYKYNGTSQNIAGIKYRDCPYYGGEVVIFCVPGEAVILDYYTKKVLHRVRDIGWNPHSVEILPDGTFIVASSSDNRVDIFAPGATKSSHRIEYSSAHGVLWDPEYDCLWINGDKTLSAYAIGGTKDAPKFVELGMHYTVEGGMHDLAPCYGDPDSLFVTCAEGILRFDKKAEIFSTSYVGSKAGVPAKYAPGCGNFEDGVFVFTSIEKGKTVYEEWCTNEVKVYVPVGAARGALLTRKAPNDAYYKVRVWCTDYQ